MSTSRSSRGRVARGRGVERAPARPLLFRGRAPTQQSVQPLAFYAPAPPVAPQFGMYMANTYDVLNTPTSRFSQDEVAYNQQLHSHEVLAEYEATYGHTIEEDTELEEPETQYEDETPDFQEVPSGFQTPEASTRRKGKEKVVAVKMEGDGKRWEHWEDVLLCSVWCNTTEKVWEQKGATYWNKITNLYNSEVVKQSGLQRGLKSLQNRWGKFLRPACMNWFAADRKTRAKVKSGENELKILERTHAMYININPAGKAFDYMHVIHILMSSEKFVSTCTRERTPTFDTVNLDIPTPPTSHSSQSSAKRSMESSNATDEVNSPVKERTRPEGVKKLKAKKQMLFNESPANQERLKQRDSLRAAEYDLEKMRIESLVAATNARAEAIAKKAEASALKAKYKHRTEQRALLKQMKEDATTPEQIHKAEMYANHFYKQCMEEDGFFN